MYLPGYAALQEGLAWIALGGLAHSLGTYIGVYLPTWYSFVRYYGHQAGKYWPALCTRVHWHCTLAYPSPPAPRHSTLHLFYYLIEEEYPELASIHTNCLLHSNMYFPVALLIE
ncbi:hypothetical protein F4802DRAFT_543470 [Xylaria palmicola]|nr:hypothetical protein F4802DRAFT_543470 [Xylaria palmicola]